MPHFCRFLTPVTMFASLLAQPLRADVFVLQSGGSIHGELVNRDESPRKTYVIKTAAGGKVTLDAAEVQKVEHQTPAEMKYDQIRSTYADTAEEQFKLAQWCRENRLAKQRKVHLERVIELDPDHADARHGLGYSHIQGRWTTQEKLMAENGYLRYSGKWMLPQEIELKEQDRKAKLAQSDWATKLKRWHGWLNSDKADQAIANIEAIDDPYAAPPLARYLNDPKQDHPRQTRLLYVEALGRIHSGAAMEALVEASLYDTDDEIRLSSLEQVVAHQYKPAVSTYVKALKHKDNPVVNRAAIGLGQLKDPSAIGPLIDSLVTVHTFTIQKGQPGQTQAAFGKGPGVGGGGFTFGGSSTETVRQPYENRDVLQALIALSGGTSFQFDRDAWKHWLASQKKPASLDARRDDRSK